MSCCGKNKNGEKRLDQLARSKIIESIERDGDMLFSRLYKNQLRLLVKNKYLDMIHSLPNTTDFFVITSDAKNPHIHIVEGWELFSDSDARWTCTVKIKFNKNTEWYKAVVEELRWN
jgi:hypothetical protein